MSKFVCQVENLGTAPAVFRMAVYSDDPSSPIIRPSWEPWKLDCFLFLIQGREYDPTEPGRGFLWEGEVNYTPKRNARGPLLWFETDPNESALWKLHTLTIDGESLISQAGMLGVRGVV